MDFNWIHPDVIRLLDGRRVFPWAITDVGNSINPQVRDFIVSRLAWISKLTGVQFVESAEPYLTFKRVDIIPYIEVQTDGLTRTTDSYTDIFFTSNELTNRNQFVLVHEIGHALGLSHPYGDVLNPGITNQMSIMSANKPFTHQYRTTFSGIDQNNLKQIYGIGDAITGTKSGDQLSGTIGPDVIIGLGGPDRIKGGLGPDWLMGGGGQDLFILKSSPGDVQWDVIEDFTKKDRISVRGVDYKDIDFRSTGNVGYLYAKNELIAAFPEAPFVRDSYLI